MKSHAFIVTSAINTRFGVFSPQQRIDQTIATINSIRSRVPTARITLIEMAGQSPSEEQEQTLKSMTDVYIDFTRNEHVIQIYKNTNSWDIVKNSTEMFCFAISLRMLLERQLLNDVARVFKVSGRYLINDAFDINLYEHPDIAEKIVFKRRMNSQFSLELTQVPLQFMSRLWSFPASMAEEIADMYDDMLRFMDERVSAGGYVDIEHCLYHFMDKNKVLELDRIGIQGLLGPNGAVISD